MKNRRVQVTSLQAQPPQAAPPSPEPTADATGSPESTSEAPGADAHVAAAGAAGRPASPDASLLLQAQLQALRQQMVVAGAEAERLDAARAEQARAAAAEWQEERDRLAADAADAGARAEEARSELQAVRHWHTSVVSPVCLTLCHMPCTAVY